MKKLTKFTLALTTVFALAGCSNNEDEKFDVTPHLKESVDRSSVLITLTSEAIEQKFNLLSKKGYKITPVGIEHSGYEEIVLSESVRDVEECLTSVKKMRKLSDYQVRHFSSFACIKDNKAFLQGGVNANGVLGNLTIAKKKEVESKKVGVGVLKTP